tara:strand:+ start:90 stop:803 length:714 start_codon:yes stop_codon:yes gene_type:complete
MNKLTLNTFIQKYNLGGNVNSVKWTSDGTKLSTRFISGDKSLLGVLELDKQSLPTFEVGVYDTAQLQKMLGVLFDNIDLTLTEVEGNPVAFSIKDAKKNISYVLAALGVIPDVPEMKTLPTFDTLVTLDAEMIDSFVKGSSALGDVDHFTIKPTSDGVEFVIGYSDMNSNRISMGVKSSAVNMDKEMHFNGKLFSQILSCNRECSKAEVQIANTGLAYVEFKVDDFVAKYWLVAQQV